jgi:hypothetical protein
MNWSWNDVFSSDDLFLSMFKTDMFDPQASFNSVFASFEDLHFPWQENEAAKQIIFEAVTKAFGKQQQGEELTPHAHNDEAEIVGIVHIFGKGKISWTSSVPPAVRESIYDGIEQHMNTMKPQSLEFILNG